VSNNAQDSNDFGELKIEKVPNIGYRWTGKTKYNDLVVEPNSEFRIEFIAVINQTGIFDLKRLKIFNFFFKYKLLISY
jgi:hypothetical protein